MIRMLAAITAGICVGILGTLTWFCALALVDDEGDL